MKIIKIDDFMRLPLFFYRSIGIEPYMHSGGISSLTKIHLFNFYFGVLNLSLMLFAEIVYVFLAFKCGDNFVEATMTMSYIGFVAVGEFKMMTVWLKRPMLTQFVNDLSEIFPKTAEAQSAYRIQYYLKRCLMVIKSFSTLYMLLIWTYNLMSIIQYCTMKYILHDTAVEQSLPYMMSIPWNWHDNWSYYLLYALQVNAGYTSAAGHISSDLLLYAVATQMIMHFDYLAHALEIYKPQALKDNRLCKIAAASDMEFLQKMIAYHEKLLRLADTMNETFGVSLLLNFMISSFVICFVGFQMSIGVGPEMQFKLGLFLLSTTAQVYLICHHSQQLIDASFNIAPAVYNQDWSNADIPYKKMLALIAKRAQKPVYLKATIFLAISRGTMTEIMQMSYKFFALLRTMYSK